MKAQEKNHPADDRLLAVYFGDEGTDVDESRWVRQHLHGCETCTWRYTELTAPLQRLRQDAASEADEVFTPARLDRQRDQILERIEHGAASSRVIPFPSAAARLDRPFVRRPLARWIAAAAAAGLILGIGAGRYLETGVWMAAPNAPGVAAPTNAEVEGNTPGRPVVGASSAPMVNADEAFLAALDQAITRPGIPELRALDELTPRAREVVVLLRR